MVTSFQVLIEKWPSVDELATDLSEKPATVRKWKQRNSIPADRWLALLAAAKQRRIKLNESMLVRLASGTQSAA